MKKQVGLWIDHKRAVIVTLNDGKEELKKITSNAQKQDDSRGEESRDNKFDNQLNEYYDEVIAFIRDADSILVFGPGEAKGEFEKRTEHEGLKTPIAVETVDKMTDGQISEKVREHFQTK